MTLNFYMVDVFGAGSFAGNPLAVVVGADSLATEEMQRITRWLNLSETVFLRPARDADADYEARIFTLEHELAFAGHPTLGACRVWLALGGGSRPDGEIVQKCGAGLVRLRREGERLYFSTPPLIRSGPPSPQELREACEFLGLDEADVLGAAWIDNGPGWLGVRLASAEKALALNPARSWPRPIDIGVVGPHPPGGEAAIEVRAFFSDHLGAVVEDPVTGSLNASVAGWLFATGVLDRDYVAAQGARVGRKGRVYVRRDEAGKIWVGGEARIEVEGRLRAV